MKIYKMYYEYKADDYSLYIKATTEKEAKKIFKSNMRPETELYLIIEVMEHQITRSDNTLNFTIDFFG